MERTQKEESANSLFILYNLWKAASKICVNVVLHTCEYERNEVLLS